MLRLLSAFLGPVFAKEMVEIARRKRYYLNRVFYGLALLLVVLLVWQQYRWALVDRPSIHLMAQIAESLFRMVSVLQYGAAFLLVPLFLCGVIASEREERTLDLLFTTQLTDREIVLGKLASRVAALVLLILCALPVLSLIMLFGGVDPEGLWRVLATTLLAVLYAGAHAIYFSAVTKSPMGALVRTYWWMAAWLLGVPMAFAILSHNLRSPAVIQFLLGGLFFLNPIAPFVAVLDPFLYSRMVSYLGFWFFPLSFVLPTGWSCFLIWRAIRRLRLAPTPLARLVRKVAPLRAVADGLRRGEALLNQLGPGRAETWLGFRVANPLWLRARRARVYDREGHVGRIQLGGWLVALVFLMLFAVVEPLALGERGAGPAFLGPTWLAVAALAAILAATSLVGDRRRGFLDLVLMTPLEPGAILDGTMLAVWQHLVRLFWLPVVLGLFFCLTTAVLPLGVLLSLLTATLFCGLLILYAVVFSLTARTAAGALLPAFLFPLLVIVGLLFPLAVFKEAAGPVVWVLSGLALAGSWVWVRKRPTAVSVGCYFMAVHLCLVALATCWTWEGWNHTGGRDVILAMNPAALTMVPVADRPQNWFDGNPYWQIGYGCYWTALAVNFVWARRWTVRHFDRLVERTRPRPAAADGPPRNNKVPEAVLTVGGRWPSG